MEGENKLIFFVDDERIILNLLEYTFSNKNGYELKFFSSAEECLEALHLHPKVVVVDHYFTNNHSSSFSGIELMEQIKAYDPCIEVIVLSSQEDPSVIDEYYSKGAFRYLAKDAYFVDELMQTLEKVFMHQ